MEFDKVTSEVVGRLERYAEILAIQFREKAPTAYAIVRHRVLAEAIIQVSLVLLFTAFSFSLLGTGIYMLVQRIAMATELAIALIIIGGVFSASCVAIWASAALPIADIFSPDYAAATRILKLARGGSS